MMFIFPPILLGIFIPPLRFDTSYNNLSCFPVHCEAIVFATIVFLVLGFVPASVISTQVRQRTNNFFLATKNPKEIKFDFFCHFPNFHFLISFYLSYRNPLNFLNFEADCNSIFYSPGRPWPVSLLHPLRKLFYFCMLKLHKGNSCFLFGYSFDQQERIYECNLEICFPGDAAVIDFFSFLNFGWHNNRLDIYILGFL